MTPTLQFLHVLSGEDFSCATSSTNLRIFPPTHCPGPQKLVRNPYLTASILKGAFFKRNYWSPSTSSDMTTCRVNSLLPSQWFHTALRNSHCLFQELPNLGTSDNGQVSASKSFKSAILQQERQSGEMIRSTKALGCVSGQRIPSQSVQAEFSVMRPHWWKCFMLNQSLSAHTSRNAIPFSIGKIAPWLISITCIHPRPAGRQLWGLSNDKVMDGAPWSGGDAFPWDRAPPPHLSVEKVFHLTAGGQKQSTEILRLHKVH